MNTIGIIGLGRMGMPTAKRFIHAGFRVVGYDIRQEAMEELRSTGAEAVEDAKRVAQKVQTVIIFVLNDQQVIDTIRGPNGVLEGCGPSSGFGKSRFVEINSSD